MHVWQKNECEVAISTGFPISGNILICNVTCTRLTKETFIGQLHSVRKESNVHVNLACIYVCMLASRFLLSTKDLVEQFDSD